MCVYLYVQPVAVIACMMNLSANLFVVHVISFTGLITRISNIPVHQSSIFACLFFAIVCII